MTQPNVLTIIISLDARRILAFYKYDYISIWFFCHLTSQLFRNTIEPYVYYKTYYNVTYTI